MREYIVTKLLLMIPTVVGLTLVVFLMMRAIPGDPIQALLGEAYTPELAAHMRAEYGFDRPLPVQYVKWLWRLVQGEWGRSVYSRRPVLDDVLARLPISLELIALSMLFALLLAIPAGVISATKPYSLRDHTAMTLSLLGISLPEFFLGILLFFLFSLVLGWLPVVGFVPASENFLQHLRHLVLPSIALGFARCALLTRLIRASLLEVIRLDYVTTARAKGLREAVVVHKHALMNALIPTVTVVGLQVGFLIGGAIVIEKVFAIPGIGSFGIDAIIKRDYPQVQGFVVVAALMFVLTNLVVDLSYGVLDPRIRYGKP
jgi:peptide/nickel transport system permease protein